jgi:phosphatidylglycerol:prolipoprotein diacylglycerol transferase
LTEYFRGDHPEGTFLIRGASPFLSLTLPQVFCLLGLGFGLGLHFWLKRRKSA